MDDEIKTNDPIVQLPSAAVFPLPSVFTYPNAATFCSGTGAACHALDFNGGVLGQPTDLDHGPRRTMH